MNSTDDLPSFIPPMCLVAKYQISFYMYSSIVCHHVFQWVCSRSLTIHLYAKNNIVYTTQSKVASTAHCKKLKVVLTLLWLF